MSCNGLGSCVNQNAIRWAFLVIYEHLNSRSEFKDSVANVFEPLLNALCTRKECNTNFPSQLSLLIKCRKQFTSLGEFIKDTSQRKQYWWKPKRRILSA